MQPLLALTPDALAQTLGGPGRARAVMRVLRSGLDPFQEGDLASGARRRLSERCRPTAAQLGQVTEARDGTLKALLELEDRRAIELVVIPSADRSTLCVSSQVGCVRGCRFCMTATMGLVRNLAAEEIVAQVIAALRLVRQRALPPLRNLVLMGMGEPLDNLDAVEAALAVITTEGGLGLGKRHVTVSTVGPSPRAVRRAASLPAHLAWSLHAAEDGLRKALVPTARHPVAELAAAFAEVLSSRAEPLFVEVTLIDGVNDGLGEADAIARVFTSFAAEVRINLLPLNPGDPALGAGSFRPSTPERVAAFRERLIDHGLFCTVRRARGADRRAACGQLVLDQGGSSRS